MVNGRRARSLRTKQLYGHVVAIHRGESDNEVKFIFADNKGTAAEITEMSYTKGFPIKEVQALRDAFSAATQSQNIIADSQPTVTVIADSDPTDFQASDSEPTDIQASDSEPTGLQASDSEPSTDSQSTDSQLINSQPTISSPLMTSTPLLSKKRPTQLDASNHRTRKRNRSSTSSDKENSFTVEGKCKGMFQASISQLMTAPEGLLTKRVSEEQVNHIKHILRDNRPRQLPVLPVMVCGGIWSGKVRRQDKFIVLGGYPLFLAVKDLSTDEKFSDYRNLFVNIFHDVETSELHQVEALYGLQASLLQGGGDRLQTKVHAFRRILYDLMKTAPDGEPVKPGLKDSAQWRRMCAASVGKSTERCAMKALEPTFQLAQYSNRCYEKLGRIFEMELEKGKEVKQSAFLPLQGVAEGERFDILGGVVSGEISLKDVKKIATEKKMDKGAKEELVRQMEVASWEEAVAEFPLHTSEEILKPYRGMDFKKSIPRSFLHLVQAAKHWKENTTGEDIMVGQEKVLFVRRAGDVRTNANIELAFVNVRQNSDITDFQEALKTRTVTVHICEDVLLAGRTVEHLEAKPHSYSVLLNKEEDKVQHLVTSVWRADGIAEKPPHLGKILTLSGGMYQTWVDRFTSPSDLVLVFGPIADATVAAVGQGRRVIAVTECREVKESVQVMIRQSSLLDGSDPYNYSDD